MGEQSELPEHGRPLQVSIHCTCGGSVKSSKSRGITTICARCSCFTGRSYSASLKYRQACQSVIVIHKLQYIQHHHYLLASSGPHQNYVEVERDFSDLPSKMQELLDNPGKAQKIAENSVRVFRERYLSPAAEACYWRTLLQAWGAASPSITAGKLSEGLRFETFALLISSEMLHFSMGATSTNA